MGKKSSLLLINLNLQLLLSDISSFSHHRRIHCPASLFPVNCRDQLRKALTSQSFRNPFVPFLCLPCKGHRPSCECFSSVCLDISHRTENPIFSASKDREMAHCFFLRKFKQFADRLLTVRPPNPSNPSASRQEETRKLKLGMKRQT